MREFKFRAWLGYRMHGNEEALRLMYNNSSEVTIFRNDAVITMQYIGLKDKNGKEIYEGDVLKQTEYIGGNFIEIIHKWFSVEWQGAVFSYKPLRVGSVQYTVRPFTENIEIIGNIYENPELLKS